MIDPMRSGRPAIPRLVSDPSLAHILTYWFVAIATMDQQCSVNLQWRLVVTFQAVIAVHATAHTQSTTSRAEELSMGEHLPIPAAGRQASQSW